MITPKPISQEKKKTLKNNFFLGNGITEKDPQEAARKLLDRDHKDVATLNENYYNGKLGAKFLPPMFCSGIPQVVNPTGYSDSGHVSFKFGHSKLVLSFGTQSLNFSKVK